MENSDDKKGSSISPRCRKGDHSRKSTDEGTAESFERQTNAMQHLARMSKGGQAQTTANTLRHQPRSTPLEPAGMFEQNITPSTIIDDQLQGSTATPETIAHPHPRTLTKQHIRKRSASTFSCGNTPPHIYLETYMRTLTHTNTHTQT